MKITKAVIPCGGMGTRFLPITKAVPKELLPIIDIPTVSYIIKEAAAAGITDVLLILGAGKDAIKKYFSADNALVDALMEAGKTDLADTLRDIASGVNISYAYQGKPAGSGDAVYYAKDFTGSEPFCLAWGDDVIIGDPPAMGQLSAAYESANTHIVGVQYYAADDITKYGVAKIDPSFAAKSGATDMDKRLIKCHGFVEKPALKDIPSRYAALGRYVLTPDIYDEIKKLKPVGGEYRFTDAISNLCEKGQVHIYDFVGKRYDMGDKLGAVKATVELALAREFSSELKQYLLELVKDF